MVTDVTVYLGSFTFFIIFLAILRDKGYPVAREYIINKKSEVESVIAPLKSSFDYNTFAKLHSKLHEYERLKSRVDMYIVCSKYSGISIIVFSLFGVLSIYSVYLLPFQNLFDAILTFGTIIFFIATASIPTIGEILTKFLKK